MKQKFWNVMYWVLIIGSITLALILAGAMTAAQFGFIKTGISMLFG